MSWSNPKQSKRIFSVTVKTTVKNAPHTSRDIRAQAQIGVPLLWHRVWQEKENPGYANGSAIDYAMQTVSSRGYSSFPQNLVPSSHEAEEDQLSELAWILSQLGFRRRDIVRAFENIERQTVSAS